MTEKHIQRSYDPASQKMIKEASFEREKLDIEVQIDYNCSQKGER